MQIIESYNARVGRIYCYVGKCLWDKQLKKYVNPRTLIGHLEGKPSIFVPNRKLSALLLSDMENPDATGERDREIITVVKVKYGKTIDLEAAKRNSNQPQIARAIFTGPSIVFGGITSYPNCLYNS
jgi:hypothetical protein